jgi:phosphoglycolate phosphatase-like HAD superfamily hydrolase
MICLDFDGVLFDTANEAFVIGSKAFFGHEAIFDNSKVNYKRFLLLRPFIDSAWQYHKVFELLIDDLSDKDILIKGKQVLKQQIETEDREFAVKFHSFRNELLKNNFTKWIDLNKPYEFFHHLKPLLVKFPSMFYICSTKSSDFISEILYFNGVNFDINRIWGRETFEANNNSKAEILENKFNKSEEILFVDDSPRHVMDVQRLKNVEAILAKWGYLETGKICDNNATIIEKIRDKLDNNDNKN